MDSHRTAEYDDVACIMWMNLHVCCEALPLWIVSSFWLVSTYGITTRLNDVFLLCLPPLTTLRQAVARPR